LHGFSGVHFEGGGREWSGLGWGFELKDLLSDAQAVSWEEEAVSGDAHIGAQAVGEIAEGSGLGHENEFAVSWGHAFVEGIGEIALGSADEEAGA